MVTAFPMQYTVVLARRVTRSKAETIREIRCTRPLNRCLVHRRRSPRRRPGRPLAVVRPPGLNGWPDNPDFAGILAPVDAVTSVHRLARTQASRISLPRFKATDERSLGFPIASV